MHLGISYYSFLPQKQPSGWLNVVVVAVTVFVADTIWLCEASEKASVPTSSKPSRYWKTIKLNERQRREEMCVPVRKKFDFNSALN